MKRSKRGRSAQCSRPLPFWGLAVVIAVLLVFSGGQVHAMWARMTDAELIRQSQWIVIGEWIGEAPLKTPEGAVTELGVIAVREVLKGLRGPTVAFVALPPSGQPVSSTDLRFRRGDRGVWFLRSKVSGGEGGSPYLVDHPQRFLRDAPENAAAIGALRQQLLSR